MRVLIYAEHFYPSVGGVEHSSCLIAEYLSQQGVQVIVVTKTLEEGDRNFQFQTFRGPTREQLHLLINESDLVYLNGMGLYILLYAKLKRKKVVMTYRDLTMVCPKGTKWLENEPCLAKASISICVPCLRRSEHRKKWFIRLVRPVLKSCFSLIIDANVCTSAYGYDNFRLFKKRLIHNAIDSKTFLPPATKLHNSIPSILFVGRLEPEKGCQILLKALAGLKKEGIGILNGLFGETGKYLRPRWGGNLWTPAR